MKLAALALVLLAAPAWAQSKKYPPVAPDKDLEEETRSELWESTLHPDTRPYRELVRDAKRLIDTNSTSNLAAALDKLDAAIQRLPNEAEAYLLRGQLHLVGKQWAKCADDLGRAEDYSKVEDTIARTRARVELAVCQARAGRLADAEGTLVRASASAAVHRGEIWMRLGEVRIALGKLDEAIDALTAALDMTDTTNDLTRWLLAVAYDRARRPADAQHAATEAKRYDMHMSQIQTPRTLPWISSSQQTTLPLLGAGDTEYLYGVAYRYATPKPEYALLYFRRFAKLAPDSPWRRRADEHVRELSAVKWPAKQTISHLGSAAFVVDDMQRLLARPVKAMQQCVAKLPGSAFQVSVTRLGARTPETVRDRPIYRLPPAGTRVMNPLNVDTAPTQELEHAMKCLEQHAKKLVLPAPKERDTYYTVSFVVVSP